MLRTLSVLLIVVSLGLAGCMGEPEEAEEEPRGAQTTTDGEDVAPPLPPEFEKFGDATISVNTTTLTPEQFYVEGWDLPVAADEAVAYVVVRNVGNDTAEFLAGLYGPADAATFEGVTLLPDEAAVVRLTVTDQAFQEATGTTMEESNAGFGVVLRAEVSGAPVRMSGTIYALDFDR